VGRSFDKKFTAESDHFVAITFISQVDILNIVKGNVKIFANLR